MRRRLLPDGSRKPESIPYGRSSGSLGELDATGLELLVVAVDVVGREEHGAGEPLRHQGLDLLGGVGVHHRRPGDRHQHDRDVGLAGRADGEPAEVAQLRDGDVGADLHPELLGVERERLVLVVDPQLGGGELDHRWPPGVVV